MSTSIPRPLPLTDYPVQVHVEPAPYERNRITTAFRILLALPHLILVGGPLAASLTWTWGWRFGKSTSFDSGVGGGLLGVAASITACLAWFAILFTGRYPAGLRRFSEFYLRWRVRAAAYATLLRDEYPPFGDGPYPATLEVRSPSEDRDRLSVLFRFLLALPQIFVVWVLGIAWAVTTMVAWFAILFTGTYPDGLYQFAVGVLRWSIRVEAYMLLLQDEYPPFSLD